MFDLGKHTLTKNGRNSTSEGSFRDDVVTSGTTIVITDAEMVLTGPDNEITEQPLVRKEKCKTRIYLTRFDV